MNLNELFLTLQEQIVNDDLKSFKSLLKGEQIAPGTLEKCGTFTDVCQLLVDMNKIKPDEKGGFDLLKRLLAGPGMRKENCVKMITKYEEEKERMRPQQVVQPQQRPQQVVQPQQAAATRQAQRENQQNPQDRPDYIS